MPACLRERSFALLLTGQASSIIGDSVSMIALPFAILAMGGSVGQVGAVLAARAIPNAILLLVGGVWADRLPRRLVMLASDIIRGLLMFIVAAALLFDVGGIWALVVLMALYGAAEAFFRPALSGIVPQTVSAKNLQEAYGLLSTTPALGIAIGGAVGGISVAVLGPAGAIAVDGLTFVISAICLSFMRTRGAPAPWRNRNFRTDLTAGWREFSSRSWLVVIVGGEVLYALFVMPSIYAIGPAISDEKLNGASSWAAVISGFGIGFLIGGLTAMKLRPARPLVLSYLLCIPFAGFLAILALTPAVALIALGAVVAGAVISISGTLLETTITREVPADMRSRVGSFRTLGSVAMMPVGMAMVGVTTGFLTTSGAIWLGAIAVLVNVVMVLATPSVRALRATYPKPGETPPDVAPKPEMVSETNAS